MLCLQYHGNFATFCSSLRLYSSQSSLYRSRNSVVSLPLKKGTPTNPGNGISINSLLLYTLCANCTSSASSPIVSCCSSVLFSYFFFFSSSILFFLFLFPALLLLTLWGLLVLAHCRHIA